MLWDKQILTKETTAEKFTTDLLVQKKLISLISENPRFYLFIYFTEKPALDPSTKKMWMLSANDMNDDDVVSSVLCVKK